MSNTFSCCPRLQELELYLPYHASTFKGATDLLSRTTCSKCSILRLNFEQYPRRVLNSLEPTAANWTALDNVLHQPQWKALTEVGVDRNVLRVDDDATFVWGNTYHWEPCRQLELERWCAELKRCLPLVYKQGKLRFDLDKDANWVPPL